jgi:hypothetical protein
MSIIPYHKPATQGIKEVCVWSMYSPRKPDFFKQFAHRIRSERILQQQKQEESATELRALQARLWRLSKLDKLLDDGEWIRIREYQTF